MPRGLPDASPAAWYALGRSIDLAPGAVEHRVFCGEEAVLFRTSSGRASLASAWCPHLGAHLARGGKVCGETLECPFHAFRFDADGQCVDTPSHAPPKRARLRTWPVMERNGLLLAWHHPDGAAPDWEVPEFFTDPDAWLPMDIHRFTLESHPQEISENSVDISHFSVVHGYSDIEELRPLRTEGAHLNGRYRMSRPSPFGSGPPVRFETDIHLHGLGVSMVNVHVLNYGFRYRLFILPTPTTAGQIELRAASSMRRALEDAPRPLLMRLIPAALLTRVVARQAFLGLLGDVQQDFEIWKNKRYIHPPVLSKGDGPIVPYRRWCRQFYPPPVSATTAAAGAAGR